MAVIDTSMDMPENCYKCPKRNVCFFAQCNGWIDNKRDDDCPLKSIDGLAEAIEQFPFTYGYASDIERTINEYCEMKGASHDKNYSKRNNRRTV